MDLYKTIRTLQDERKRLDELIDSLEHLQVSENGYSRRKPPVRRGRKGMNAEERRKVSERMKKYWAAKRGGSNAAGGADSHTSSAASA